MSAEQENLTERKTLDDRAKMTELERLRHSAAHVMATAILRLWPDAQFAAGPPVENGFYYDVDLKHRISPEDFPAIEAEMKKEIKANNVFEKIVVTREQALKDSESGRLGGLTERPGNPSKFKIGNLEAIPEGEQITYFKNGDFVDLCAGPHVMRTGNIGAFKLTSVASAYYKGDERNPQLQRIYGTAFKNKTALDEYFKMIEEAKRRDHRKIGVHPVTILSTLPSAGMGALLALRITHTDFSIIALIGIVLRSASWQKNAIMMIDFFRARCGAPGRNSSARGDLSGMPAALPSGHRRPQPPAAWARRSGSPETCRAHLPPASSLSRSVPCSVRRSGASGCSSRSHPAGVRRASSGKTSTPSSSPCIR